MKRGSLVFCALVLAAGCSDNNSNRSSNNISFAKDTGMTTGGNNIATDTGMSPADMGAPEDLGTADAGEELDFAVAAEGFLHGSWVARTAGAEIATLELRHEAGETSLAGTYQMVEPPAFGQLGGSNWQNDQFTTSWTIQIDGLDQRFGLAMCTRAGSDDELACRYSDPVAGDITDATLTRQ